MSVCTYQLMGTSHFTPEHYEKVKMYAALHGDQVY